MTTNFDTHKEQKERKEWIESIAQGQVSAYKGNCLKCGKPFDISPQRTDDNLLEMSQVFYPSCARADHDPEIRGMVVQALEKQPELPWNHS